jgi:hypothetical protein
LEVICQKESARQSGLLGLSWNSSKPTFVKLAIAEGLNVSQFLLYLGALLPIIWGIAHLIPTRSVVRGFGDISVDNRRIITMEWINEGLTLIFIGVLVAAVTMTGDGDMVATVASLISSVALIVIAIISIFTGFRVAFFPFKLCPILFTTSAILIAIGSLSTHYS